jgi:hypothetical protein
MNYMHFIYPMMRSLFASLDGYQLRTSHYETWSSISHARRRNQRNKSQKRKHR